MVAGVRVSDGSPVRTLKPADAPVFGIGLTAVIVAVLVRLMKAAGTCALMTLPDRLLVSSVPFQ